MQLFSQASCFVLQTDIITYRPRRYGGVMIWELGQDKIGEQVSLTAAIFAAAWDWHWYKVGKSSEGEL